MKTVITATIATLVSVLAAPVLAEGDAAKGEKLFKKCKACHTIGDGAKNRTGPVLTGILDNKAGQNPNYKYSSGMKEAAAGGLVWDAASLTSFLTKPKAFVKGTRMGFPGFKKPTDIENVLAYLATFE
jgi:cytochrome c